MALRELWRRTSHSALQHRQSNLNFLAAPASAHQVGQQVRRGLAVDRPEDSSTSNWGTGEPPIDEKATERGVSESKDTSSGTPSESDGEVWTPHLTRQKSTRDFINTKREERMKSASEGTTPEIRKQQQIRDEVTETGAAHPGELAGG